MLQAMCCGYLGADAEKKSENGREFTTFRVAHTDRWTDQQGVQHDSTQWVDVILNGHPNVADYLKAGTLVYVAGHMKLRCYSSEKARGFVAGVTISATSIELLGGQGDVVPRRLYDAAGTMHNVTKYYNTDVRGEVLTNGRGKSFHVDDNGWVFPLEGDTQQSLQKTTQEQTQAGQQAEEKQTKSNKKNK